MISIALLGDKDLERKLNFLAESIQNKIIKKATKEAVKPMLRDAKSTVQILTGAGQQSLKVYLINKKTYKGAKVSTSKGLLSKSAKKKIAAAIKKGTDLYIGDTFYLAFLEFGTKHQKAYPFLRPAFNRNKSRAVVIVGDVIRTEIAKYIP